MRNTVGALSRYNKEKEEVKYMREITLIDTRDIEIIEYPSEYCFAVKFTSKTGVPYNIADIQAMIEEIKPAHLAVEYIFTYRLWQDVLDEIQIWTTAKNYSWEWMLTFEVKSNLNISDSGIFYCPDGNGNGKVIWNSSKAYARRNE